MPVAVPIIVAAAQGALVAGIATNFVLSTMLIVAAVNAAVAGLGMLLQSGRGQSQPQQSFPTFNGSAQVTARQPDAVRPLVYGECRVQGVIVYLAVTDNNQTLHVVVAFTGHEIDSFVDLYFDDQIVPIDLFGNCFEGQYVGRVHVQTNKGAPGEVAFSDLIAACPDDWTVDHIGHGVASAYLRLTWDRDTFPNGLPNIWWKMRGRKLYDPRTGHTAWSANASLAVADYIADRTYSLGAPIGDEQDADILSAAANICDEDIALAEGGTEKRYEAHGIVNSDVRPADAIGGLLSASAGRAVFVAGKWLHMPAAWQEPTEDFDENDLRDGYSVQNLLSSADAFNAIKGKFCNPAKLWQPDDFPAITSAAYEAEDGGLRVFKDIQLSFTTSPSMAQRLARIDLRRGRQPLTMVWPVKLKGWRCIPGDTVTITDPQLGWDHKIFEVLNVEFAFGEATDDNGPPIVGVDLQLREITPEIFDWTSSDEITVDPAPNTNFPDPFNVLPPSNLTVVETLYGTRAGGGVKDRVRLAWDASPDAFVQSGGYYVPEYKLSTASDWTQGQQTRDTKIDWFDFGPGVYDFRVSATNGLGVKSAYLTVVLRQIYGLASPPAAPANLTVETAGGGTLAVLRWDRSTDLDVLEGGSIEFRHSGLTSGATWADGQAISDPLSGSLTAAILPQKSGTYLAKFVDSTGNRSLAFAAVVSKQAGMLAFSTIGSSVESPAFAGTKYLCAVDEHGALMIGGAGNFDDVPDVDALPSWDFFGGVRTDAPIVLGAPSTGAVLGAPGLGFILGTPTPAEPYYEFAAPLDLGTVRHCRLTAATTARVVNVTDDFDSRATNCDTWANWDGDTNGNEADGRMYVRTTNDDPFDPGAVWSDWQRLDSAEHYVRGVWPRYYPVSHDPVFNLAVTTLGVVAEAVI